MKLVKNNLGFTLIETMIVIAIISIVSTVGYFTLRATSPIRELKSAARNIVYDFQNAKNFSARNHSKLVVVFDSNGYIIFEDANKNFIKDFSEKLYRERNFLEFKGVSFDKSEYVDGIDGPVNSEGDYAICFIPIGFITSWKNKDSGLTIYLQSESGRKINIRTLISGIIRISDLL